MAKKLEKITDLKSFQVPDGFELVEKTNGRYSLREVDVGDELLILAEVRGRGRGIYLARGVVQNSDFDINFGQKYIVLTGNINVYTMHVNGNGKIYRLKK